MAEKEKSGFSEEGKRKRFGYEREERRKERYIKAEVVEHDAWEENKTRVR